MPVTVKWGKDRFEFELPDYNIPLAAIRQSIATYTHLPYHGFLIIHDGAVMKEDNAPISAYNLGPNSAIAIVSPSASQPTPFKNTEQAQISSIQSELSAVSNSLLPALSQFLADLSTRPKQSLEKEHSRLAELLLQALLRIDAIVPERDWDTARAHRKAAVKQLQSLLDQLDSDWANST